jgi:hypothetical protein
MKIPGTPFETLARTGAPGQSESTSVGRLRLSRVITHRNIWDEVSRDAVNQTDKREFPIALSPIHDVFSDEDIQRKELSTRMYVRFTHPCEAIVHHLLTSAYTQQ